ncbi:MAG: hypothetical protein U0802_16715 [Candidatus Binatia bacterium]
MRAVAAVVLLATGAWAASNLNLSKSNINRLAVGKLLSASVNLVGQVSALVYTTPADADVVLTQVCVGKAAGGVLVQIAGVGIAQVGSGSCQTFSPGLILTRDAPLSCTSFDPETSSFCSITGIVGLASPPTPTPRA